MTDVVIVGAGSLGRESLAIFLADNSVEGDWEVLGFLDEDSGKWGTRVCDKPVLGGLDWFSGADRLAVRTLCAIGDPCARRSVVQKLTRLGVGFCTVIHPSVSFSPWVDVGVGCVIMAGSVLSTQVRIGAHVVINPGCTISHDSTLSDFCYISPGCNLTGNVVLDVGVSLGANVSVIPGKKVGAWSVVGAGAVVISDIPERVVAAGVPCEIKKEYDPALRAKQK